MLIARREADTTRRLFAARVNRFRNNRESPRQRRFILSNFEGKIEALSRSRGKGHFRLAEDRFAKMEAALESSRRVTGGIDELARA